MSAPMPNPFDYNSAPHVPVDAGSAGATPCPQPRAPAAPIADPDRGYMGHRLTPALGTSVSSAAIDSCQEPMAADIKEDDLYWSLRLADDPFERDLPEIPNPRALFDAIKGDPVWADPAPMFLQNIGEPDAS